MLEPERQFETPEILHDAPLRDDDSAHFHFDEFAITLARLIADKKTRTPLTLGISGPWGSGKTTLLKRVRNLLDEPVDKDKHHRFANDTAEGDSFRRCKTVWFNAWKYADEDELLVALVRVIVQSMADDDIVSSLIGKLRDPSYPRRDVVNTVLGWFSIKVGDIGIGLDTGTPQPTPFAEKTAMLDLFDDAFDRLLAAWVHRKADAKKIDPQQGVLVVFIDDLDRCLPGKMVQVLEAIKLFLDKPGCVFVLGADKSVIQQAVAKHYADAGVTGESAKDYLEKIIQLRFELPPIVTETMQAYLNDQQVDAAMLARWQALVAAAEINPRRVKSVINDLNLQWTMALNADQSQGLNRDDFICWQALMHAAPAIFTRRVMNFEDLERRHSFVLKALQWVGGSSEEQEQLAGTFREYEDDEARRMRMVLKRIGEFGPDFTPQSLDAIIHLTAPPQEIPAAVETPIKIRPEEEVHPVVKAERLRGLPDELRGKLEGKEVAPARAGVRQWGGIQFVPVPAGKFIMGSKADNELARDNEHPQHTVDMPYEYWLARYPITNTQYNDFAQAQGSKHPVENWQEKEDHPVVNVSWNDAMAYCQWLDEALGGELPEGYRLSLPTEAEWEKAARGEYGNEWPWGNEWDPAKCNSSEGKVGKTTPVGQYSPAGNSPYGAADMAGHVWEWTHSLFKDYPYVAEDGREDESGSGARV
ncbi:MAG: SUMF1/EgtB/PvdO family nonheme iron enzyme, partial [Chloroflexi bacterium]|nr:SUMF1/EgtB/PvdO family nonheme iron enzyme [Chloroflexota bacterium]